MLDGVQHRRRQKRRGIGADKAKIVGDNIAVGAGKVHPRLQHGMVDLKAGNAFHGVGSSFGILSLL